jgi:hypothetical protein
MNGRAPPSTGQAGGSAELGERLVRHRMRLRVSTGSGSAFTINLSRGGYCTEQTRILPVGTSIQGSIALDGGDLDFVGRVAWSAAGEHRLNQPGRMGVQFERISQGFFRCLDLRAARSPFRAAVACA